MLIKTKMEMDLAHRSVTPRVDAVQGDTNTRAMEISLYENSAAWVPPEGTTAAVAFMKPDGTRGLYDTLPDGSPATVIEGNVVAATLAPQVLTISGAVAASVILTNGGAQVATFPFLIEVVHNPGAGALESTDYYKYSTLEELNAAVGSLDDLKTEDKSSLVAALNEVAEAANGGTRETVTAIDFSNFASGSFTETVNGEEVNHTVTFDTDGRPVTIDGVSITWGDA